MGYLQALQLMVRAYKAAKGVMPKGLDLLKLKMRARKKAIDAKKVIEFPKDKITPFYKPRPEGIQNLIKRGDVKIGQAPKTTKVKEPVDSKLILQESEKEMAKRMMRENKEAIKRFKEKMKKPRDDKATGGLANLSQTYDNNPTLQSQFPDKQDYLDLFSSTTTTTPQTQTYTQMTQQSPAGITAVKPIVPIIQPLEGEGGGGGITTVDKGLTVADNYGLGVADPTGMGYELTEKDLADIDKARFTSGMKSVGYDLKNLYGKFSPLAITKSALKKGQDIALNVIEKAKAAARARELAKLQAAAKAAGFQGDDRTKEERDFASSQTYGGGGSGRDQGADTFDI